MESQKIDSIREKKNIEYSLKEMGGARFFTKLINLIERNGRDIQDNASDNFGNIKRALKKEKIKISMYTNCVFSLNIQIYYENKEVLELMGTAGCRPFLKYVPEIYFAGNNYSIEKYSPGKWEQEIKKICV